MLTGELRNKVDRIWEIFWTGGIANPLEVIEQFTYLLFIKQLDDVETTKETEASFLSVPYEGIFPKENSIYRWSKFKNLGSAKEMYDVVLNEAAEKSTVYLIGILILALKMALYQFFKFKSL